MSKIDILKYGKLYYNQLYILKDNKIQFMSYEDKFKNTLSLNSNRIINNWKNYIVESSIDGKKLNSSTFFPNKELLFYKKGTHVKNNKFYSRSRKDFDIKFQIGNIDHTLCFDKDKYVIGTEDYRQFMVYEFDKKGIVDFSKKSEEYYFIRDNLCLLKFNDIYSIFGCDSDSDINIEYTLFRKNKINCLPLSKLPTYISFNNLSININYSDEGIVTKMTIPTVEQNIIRNEVFEYRYCKVISSLHPLLFDPFNFNCNPTKSPLQFWIIERLSIDSDIIQYERQIYEIDKPDELIVDLNTEMEIPRIDVFD